MPIPVLTSASASAINAIADFFPRCIAGIVADYLLSFEEEIATLIAANGASIEYWLDRYSYWRDTRWHTYIWHKYKLVITNWPHGRVTHTIKYRCHSRRVIIPRFIRVGQGKLARHIRG
jgi:hypothetical protein